MDVTYIEQQKEYDSVFGAEIDARHSLRDLFHLHNHLYMAHIVQQLDSLNDLNKIQYSSKHNFLYSACEAEKDWLRVTARRVTKTK